MIDVKQEGKHVFLIKLDVPDTVVIHEIALGLGMKTSDVIVSCINKGIAYYADMLREIAVHDTRKRTAQENHGTYEVEL